MYSKELSVPVWYTLRVAAVFYLEHGWLCGGGVFVKNAQGPQEG